MGYHADTLIIKAAENTNTILKKESSKEAQLEARKDILPNEVDPVKAESAAIFKQKWTQKMNEKYLQLYKSINRCTSKTKRNFTHASLHFYLSSHFSV